MTFDKFLSHLDGVKGNGNQRYARCPAHEDKRQSLSVSVADDGKILLHCHAGCTAKDITEAMGLSIKDLFVDKAVPTSKTVVATYKYIDQNRKTSEKLRYSNKSFQWRHKDKNGGWEYNRKGISPSLYMTGWGQLQSPVYLVEGKNYQCPEIRCFAARWSGKQMVSAIYGIVEGLRRGNHPRQ